MMSHVTVLNVCQKTEILCLSVVTFKVLMRGLYRVSHKKSYIVWRAVAPLNNRNKSWGCFGILRFSASHNLLSEPFQTDLYGRESKQRRQPIFNSRGVGTLSTFR